MSLDLAPDIRTAILGDATITGLITEFNGEPAVFTRRPVPDAAAKPFILIAPDVNIGDADGLTSRRPVVTRDIFVYGAQPDDYRSVEQIGYFLQQLFHRQKSSIVSDDYHIIEITVTGPRPAPTSDEETVGRVVTLTILTREK